MSLRWKNQLPQLQPSFVDPAGVNATRMQGYQPGVVPTSASYAAQDMQGYNPNNVYMVRVSDQATVPDSRVLETDTSSTHAKLTNTMRRRTQSFKQCNSANKLCSRFSSWKLAFRR